MYGFEVHDLGIIVPAEAFAEKVKALNPDIVALSGLLTLVFDQMKETACISGNLPNSLMVTGTPDDVKEYCKKLIDYCGKDGGYIMDTAACLYKAKTENVKTMFEFTREYGVNG